MTKDKKTNGDATKRPATAKKVAHRSERFKQLLALAREGDQDAIGDLYREFDHVYDGEDSSHA